MFRLVGSRRLGLKHWTTPARSWQTPVAKKDCKQCPAPLSLQGQEEPFCRNRCGRKLDGHKPPQVLVYVWLWLVSSAVTSDYPGSQNFPPLFCMISGYILRSTPVLQIERTQLLNTSPNSRHENEMQLTSIMVNFTIFFFSYGRERFVSTHAIIWTVFSRVSNWLTWLNVVAPRAAGEDSEFATKGLQYTPLQEGGTSSPKPKYTGCCRVSRQWARTPPAPFIKMFISWSTGFLVAATAGSVRVPQPEAASMEQLPSSWSVKALEPAVQTASQQDTWIVVKAHQSRNFWDRSLYSLHLHVQNRHF